MLVKMDRVTRRKVCPFEMEASMKQKYNLTEADIKSVRTGFVIKCKCEQ